MGFRTGPRAEGAIRIGHPRGQYLRETKLPGRRQLALATRFCVACANDEFFDYCVDITAVHYPKREAQFDIVYILYSFHNNERLRIKTQVKDGEHLRSAVGLWPTANWLERELFDMFGIEFDGHPELKRILMPDGWKGHPLRKDYGILQQDQDWVKTNIGIESAQ